MGPNAGCHSVSTRMIRSNYFISHSCSTLHCSQLHTGEQKDSLLDNFDVVARTSRSILTK